MGRSTNDDMTEREKKNKKIIFRFLKEVGLLKAWKEYTGPMISKGINVYNMEYVDEVFNMLSFTSFLRKSKGINLLSPITCIFRHWYMNFSESGLPDFNERLSNTYITSEKGDYTIKNNRIFWTEGYGLQQKK
jgi:hypothetical protein